MATNRFDWVYDGFPIGDLRVRFTLCTNAETLGFSDDNGGPLTAAELVNEFVHDTVLALESAMAPRLRNCIETDGIFSRWNGGRLGRGSISRGVFCDYVRVGPDPDYELDEDEDEADIPIIVIDYVPTLTPDEKEALNKIGARMSDSKGGEC